MDIPQSIFNRELFLKAARTRTPVVGAFELTGRCNLSCLMCYVRKGAMDRNAIREELTADQWLDVGRQASEAGLLYLLLTGGEVFLRPDFFEIYEGLKKLGLQISINTNATLITPETARRLSALPPRSVAVTVYGASPETYKRVSGDPAAFERTMRGIRLLRDAGLTVRIRTTLIRQNYMDLEKIHALSREMGLDFRLVDYVFKNRGQTDADPFAVRLSPARQWKCQVHIRELFLQDGAESPASETVDEGSRYSTDSAFSCAAGLYSFAVSHTGKLTACLLLDEPGVSLSGGFQTGWNKLGKLCDNIPACEECASCGKRKFCKTCPAKLRGETGFFDRAAPYLCELAALAEAK